MAHTKSALKRARTSNEDRLRNKAAVSLLKTHQKKVLDAVAAKDGKLASEAYKSYCAVLDKAAKKGAITRNTAIRKKARGAAQVRKLKAA
jgi:small subunit ribosomal protein S20